MSLYCLDAVDRTDRIPIQISTAKDFIMYRTRGNRAIHGALSTVAIILAWAMATAPAWAQAADATAIQTSVDRGVTVKVTLRSMGTGGGPWAFEVVFDTHGGDLLDDLIQSSSLTTGDGRTFKPVSWTGAAPGGHHREGVLAFDLGAARPSSVELRIARPGESAPRTFRWQL
jgi:hypothetical protein